MSIARDWIQIQSELDDLRPKNDSGRRDTPTRDAHAPPAENSKAEDALLRHIAVALCSDENDEL
jgi:hypothetical protein